MELEEALAWCVEHAARVEFTTQHGLHWVRIFRDGGRVVGAGCTLVQAVEAAVDVVLPES